MTEYIKTFEKENTFVAGPILYNENIVTNDPDGNPYLYVASMLTIEDVEHPDRGFNRFGKRSAVNTKIFRFDYNKFTTFMTTHKIPFKPIDVGIRHWRNSSNTETELVRTQIVKILYVRSDYDILIKKLGHNYDAIIDIDDGIQNARQVKIPRKKSGWEYALGDLSGDYQKGINPLMNRRRTFNKSEIRLLYGLLKQYEFAVSPLLKQVENINSYSVDIPLPHNEVFISDPLQKGNLKQLLIDFRALDIALLDGSPPFAIVDTYNEMVLSHTEKRRIEAVSIVTEIMGDNKKIVTQMAGLEESGICVIF